MGAYFVGTFSVVFLIEGGKSEGEEENMGGRRKMSDGRVKWWDDGVE